MLELIDSHLKWKLPLRSINYNSEIVAVKPALVTRKPAKKSEEEKLMPMDISLCSEDGIAFLNDSDLDGYLCVNVCVPKNSLIILVTIFLSIIVSCPNIILEIL